MSAEDWHQHETYKSLISISVDGFKLLALLNGGAAAGMLTAFQHLSKVIPISALKVSIGAFSLGMFLIGVTFLFSYATQLSVYIEGKKKKPQGSHICHLRIAMGLCTASLSAFLVGAAYAVAHAESGPRPGAAEVFVVPSVTCPSGTPAPGGSQGG